MNTNVPLMYFHAGHIPTCRALRCIFPSTAGFDIKGAECSRNSEVLIQTLEHPTSDSRGPAAES